MKNKCNIYIPIQKIDKKKKMVYGYATTEAVDSQGEVVEKNAIRKAWDDYMQWANVREMHRLSAVGKTKEYMHDDKGTWVGVKVIDKTAWEKVLEKVYMGFSIGGDILKQEGNRIKEIILSEISLVDRPSCPEAKFEMVKRDNRGVLVNKQKVDNKNLIKENMPEEKITNEDEEKTKKTVDDNPDENKEEDVEEKKEDVSYKEESKEEENDEEENDDEEEDEEDDDEEKEKSTEEENDEEENDEEEDAEKENNDKDDEEEEKELNKDVREMSALSEVVTNLNYLVTAFKENDRPNAVTGKMEEALKLLMEATRLETKKEKVQKIESFDDLSRVFKDEFGKLQKSFDESKAKVEELDKEVTSLKEQTDENQKKRNVPKTVYTVEKAEKEENRLESLQKEMQEIRDEITKTHEEAKALVGSGDISKESQIEGKLNDLQKRFSDKKVELKKFVNEV